MRGSKDPCDTCRYRRVKCDGEKPVCGRCTRDDRQCLRSGAPTRLIIKDETQKTIKKLSSKKKTVLSETSSSVQTPEAAPSTTVAWTQEANDRDDNDEVINEEPVTELERWQCIANQRVYNQAEQLLMAIRYCRDTFTFGTLGALINEWNWVDAVTVGMQNSDAFAAAVRANAINEIAKASGAKTTPYNAYIEYSSALKHLQRDLYDPKKQTSYETLFTVLLLGIFDIHKGQNPDVWKTHLEGACKIVQCIGPEEYRQNRSTKTRQLAQYLRGIDCIRAIGRNEETIFGTKEWDHVFRDPEEPIDGMFHLCGKLSNTIAQCKKLDLSIESNLGLVYDIMLDMKKEFRDWKERLPSYYEPIVLPTHYLEFEDAAIMIGYPYGPRLEYIATIVGHAMNMYRAGILTIGIFLSDLFHYSVPQTDIQLAHEIVMSMPSLVKNGGLLLVYPGRQASKVLGREYREYIGMILTKIASESISAARAALAVRASNGVYEMTCEDYEILRET